ncbi:MAG TPA: hypothetical protein VHX87_02765 [Galbitalea sp.]|jgi:hypothetical protein|nr:hypothetical protein [Galbitalea sp.]
MTASAPGLAARPSVRFRPAIGRSIPASVVRLILAVVIVFLCVAVIGWQLLLAVALVFALAALAFPTGPMAWLLAGLLAVVALGGYAQPPDWRFFAVLAGAHLLHLAGMTLRWLPVSGPVQLRVLGRILRTFVVIQVPAQIASLLVLTLLAGRSVVSTLSSPAFGIVAGAGLLLLVVAVVIPIVRGGPDR